MGMPQRVTVVFIGRQTGVPMHVPCVKRCNAVCRRSRCYSELDGTADSFWQGHKLIAWFARLLAHHVSLASQWSWPLCLSSKYHTPHPVIPAVCFLQMNLMGVCRTSGRPCQLALRLQSTQEVLDSLWTDS